MQTLKVTNKTDAGQYVHTATGPKLVEGKQSLTADFNAGEARNIAGNTAVFDVEGYDAEAAEAEIRSAGASVQQQAQPAGDPDAEKARDDARNKLHAIAKLFDPEAPPEAVDTMDLESLVRGVQEQVAAFDPDGDGNTGGSKKKPTLAEAVASLDNANDEHWTQGGTPKLAYLKSLTGEDVTTADLAALPADQQRTRVVA
jgi:hypothetical protein